MTFFLQYGVSVNEESFVSATLQVLVVRNLMISIISRPSASQTICGQINLIKSVMFVAVWEICLT